METECYPCIPMQHVSVQNSPPLATMAPTFTASSSSATSKKARIVTTNGIGNGGAFWAAADCNLHDSKSISLPIAVFAGTRVVTIKREPLSPNSGDDVNVVDDDSNGFASGPTTIVTRYVGLSLCTDKKKH